LRVIKDFPTALRQDREKEIALPKLKRELAIHPGIHVHQLDGVTEIFTAFPHTIHLDEPYVVLCVHDLTRKDILGAVETFCGRAGSACTYLRSAGPPRPTDRQYKKPRQVLHWISDQHWSSLLLADERCNVQNVAATEEEAIS
jgi:hypothetical protein